MINLSAFVDSLKLTWMRRLLRDNGKWQLLTQNKFDLNKLITCGEHFCEGTITTLLNKFWKDVLNAYLNLLKMYEPKGEFDFLSSPLLYNIEIKINGNPIKMNSWQEKGLFYINDILNENGTI